MSAKYKANVELLAVTPDAERLIESCGRTCYESYDKITEDSHQKIIRHLMKSGHHSVFEHASASFRFTNVSRALMAQLTRHRLASYSIQSLRYVDKAEIESTFDKNYFDTIDTKDKAYILGLLFSDGNIYVKKDSGHYIVSIKLQSSDSWILYKIKSLIGNKSNIHHYEEEGSGGTHKLHFGCKHMVAILIDKYGLTPDKSKTLRGDKALAAIPENLRSHFLLGVFDGDGSVGVANRSSVDVFAGITSYSDAFLEDLHTYFPILRTQSIKHHAIKFQGKHKVFNFLDYLYSDIEFTNDIFLIRKFCKSISISTAFYEKYKSVLENERFVIPPTILNNQKALAIYYQQCKLSFADYLTLRILGVKKEDCRMLLPISTKTTIDMTINFRSLFNFFNLRGDIHAQWEIRKVAMAMLTLVKEHAPTVFENYENDWDKEIIRRIQNV